MDNIIPASYRQLCLLLLAFLIVTGCAKKSDDTPAPQANYVFAGIANSAQVVTVSPNGLPPATYTGGAVITGVFNPNNNQLTYNLQWSFPTADPPTLAHFHRGAAGQSGLVDVNIFTTTQIPIAFTPTSATITLTADQATAFLAGNWYLQLHSASYPAGAIRLQLRPIQGAVAYSAALLPSNPQTNQSAGTLAGTYNRNSRTLNFTLGYGIASSTVPPDLATAATINNTNGNTIVATYNSSSTPAFAVGTNLATNIPRAIQDLYINSSTTLTTAQETDFLANRFTMQINTNASPAPSGLIRGTINTLQ